MQKDSERLAGQACPKTIRSVLAEDGVYLGTAAGVSMKPLIRESIDLIEVVACDAAQLHPMDIVLFWMPGRAEGSYVLHRVVRVEDDAITTLGDNCVATEHVRPDWVLGKLVGLYRNGSKANALQAKAYGPYVALCCRPWKLRVHLVGGYRHVRHLGGVLLRRLGLRREKRES